jgi:hypothetical protein
MKSGQAGVLLLLTPETVRAGVDAFLGQDREHDSYEDIVVAIFQAMAAEMTGQICEVVPNPGLDRLSLW